MTSSNYVSVGSRKLHFYVMGEGPALVLFHPSPHTSEILLPLAKELTSNYKVFLIDTPGYGKSDALEVEPTSLHDYANFLHKAFQVIGLKQPVIYGSATGAQIAIRYALEYPDAVSHIFLDNAAHFEDGLRNRILEYYFPDLTPRIDGGHLTQIWTMVSQIFQYFPWCFTSEEYALNRPQPPVAALHFVAMDYLKAGKDYDYAYRLAFQHERGAYVQQLKVPTTIFRWNKSIIVSHIDDLLAFEFPSNILSYAINGEQQKRMELMIAFMKNKSDSFSSCEVSDTWKPYIADVHLSYKKENVNPTEIHIDGTYLQQAWNSLVLKNPKLNAEQIQSCLIDWYTRTT